MHFRPYVILAENGAPVSVSVSEATDADLLCTAEDPKWQSDWTSDYLNKPDISKYTIKTQEGECIGLAAYQIIGKSAYVFILYAESAPHSNPTLTSKNHRKYYGIGQLLVAFGIKYSIDNGCRGDVVFDAKTEELAKHYEKDFKAKRVAGGYDGIKRYMLADDDAWQLFSIYLEED